MKQINIIGLKTIKKKCHVYNSGQSMKALYLSQQVVKSWHFDGYIIAFVLI